MVTPATCRIPPPKSWDEFENICLDILKKQWPNATRHGRTRQEQTGVDIYGRHPNIPTEWAAAQCKCVEKISLNDIKVEVSKAKKFEPTPHLYLVMTTTPRDVNLQVGVRTTMWPLNVCVWFWDDIILELASYPELMAKHYPGWKIDPSAGTTKVYIDDGIKLKLGVGNYETFMKARGNGKIDLTASSLDIEGNVGTVFDVDDSGEIAVKGPSSVEIQSASSTPPTQPTP